MTGTPPDGAETNESGPIALRRPWHEHSLARFVTTGGLTFILDITVLKVLHGILGVNLLLATSVAFGCAFALNFTLSRRWAFVTGRDEAAHRQMTRFAALVVVNLLATVLIVGGLAAAGLNYLIAKVAAAATNATGNYLAYRHWVFR